MTAQIADPKDLQIAALRQECDHLKEQISWFKRQLFGKRSERIVSDLDGKQMEFEGFETAPPPEEFKQLVPTHERRKPNRNGQDKITLPPDLPVERIVLDIPEGQKVCPETGELLVKIGEEISHKLAQTPATFFIKEIVRPKYAHPKKPDQGILYAELPDAIIPRCRADESFLAEMVTRKFADHLPLNRISEILSREGVFISRKLLSQWVVRLGETLKPLCDLMLEQILSSGNIFGDEVPIAILDKGHTRKGYMWTIVGGEGPNPPYRVYNFREDRKHENIWQLLAGYKGVLHSDKYGAYEAIAQTEGIIWCPCWAHIRRKFFEAEMGDIPLREWVLAQIKDLFTLEETAWTLSVDERLRMRREQEAPIIDELITRIKGRLIQGRVLPKSKFREALGYFCGLIPYLKNYTLYPNARLDNNVAERAIRPLVIGRKNWLFFGNAEGGESAGVLMSFVQTCRGLGINPREYLEDVFRRFMGHPANRLHELLPDQWRTSRRQAAAPHN